MSSYYLSSFSSLATIFLKLTIIITTADVTVTFARAKRSQTTFTHTQDFVTALRTCLLAISNVTVTMKFISIGADPVVVRGSGPHKNLLVESSMTQTPTKILLKEI